jgi:hypothetical protein
MTVSRPPDRSAALDRMLLADLRAYRASLREQEERVSYWRRLVQARLDILRSGTPIQRLDVAALTRALGETAFPSSRAAFLTVADAPLPTDLPDLAGLWSSHVDPADPATAAPAIRELEAAETTLSDYRAALHEQIDHATEELIARYRANLHLTDQLIPRQP